VTAPRGGEAARPWHPVQFILLCLLVGPAIGFVFSEFADWLDPNLVRAPLFSDLNDRRNWLGVYWIGGILAVVAAVIFVVIKYKFGYSGLGTAVAAVSVVPVISVISGAIFANGPLEFHAYGIVRYLALCVVPMSVCWLLARATRIIQ
jgi:hypothetical protein